MKAARDPLEASLRKVLGDHYPGAAFTSKGDANVGGEGGGDGAEGAQIKAKCDCIKALSLRVGAIYESGELLYSSLIAGHNVG